MTVLELRQKRAALHERMEALHAKAEAENRDFTDVERQAWDDMRAEANQLKERLERQEFVDGEGRDVRQVANQPVGDNGQQQAPNTENPWRSFGHFLLDVRAAAYPEGMAARQRLETRATELRATGMSEGAPADGGFLVETDYTTRLLEKAYTVGQIANRCERQPIGAASNGTAFPMIAESSRANGSRWGGIRGYWTGEGGTITASRPTIQKNRLDLDKITVLCYMTDELLQDAPGLEAYVNRTVPKELSFKLEDGIINGSGAGMPLGIVGNAPTVSVAKETGQAAATVVTENIVKMWARAYAAGRPNSIWLINQDIEPQLFTMSLAVGTGGIPVYMPANGLSDTPFGRLMGRPVLPVEYCATLGTVGDILLVDLSQYLLIDKAGIQSASSIHVQFLTDETVFRFIYRVNGMAMWDSALTPFKGSNTLSPFVSLATRA